MIKTAVVGTGSIGEEHLSAIENLKEFQLCAVCDTNEEKGKAFAKKYGVRFFENYKDIPSQTDAETVILNLPHFLHCDAAVFFLEHGIDVLVEKPMANTVEECDRMIEAAKKNGKKLAVGHVQRYFASNAKVKEYIETKQLGELVMCEEHRTIDYFSEERPKWFLDKKAAGGGIVMNYGAHALDKIFYLTGMKTAEITSLCANKKNNCNIEGHAQFFMKFENGLSAAVTFSGYGYCGYDTVYYFTNGALKVSDTLDLSEFKNGKWEKIEVKEDGKFMERQLEEFAKMLKNKDNKMPDGEYGKAVISLIEKIYA